MAHFTYAILALVPCVFWYLWAQLRQWRNKYSHVPMAYPRSLILGHLQLIGEGFQKLEKGHHIDYVLKEMLRAKGDPEILFLDLRPINFPMVVVATHDIAEQISRPSKIHPYSVTKSPTMQGTYRRLVGPRSLLSEEDESWRTLRKRFNLGFAPSHLITLLPSIVDKTSIFMSKLDALAETGETFEMDNLCTNLTFDIIGQIVTNLDFQAQDESVGGIDIVHHFKTQIGTYQNNEGMFAFLNPKRRFKRLVSSIRLDAAIKRCIKAQFKQIKESQRTETRQAKDRSVIALALQDIDELNSDILQTTADQVKTFLFAGHDTTSILLQRLFHELSIHPECLATLRAEHDAIFGDRDPREVLLEKPDDTMKRLSYTSACIKEALRLWPPAGTARRALPGAGFKIRLEDGQEVCLDGMVLYVCHFLIQRDPKVYGETANDFVPERWLGDIDTSEASKDLDGAQVGASKIPISAWRAFERGPRNCIGQELANLEARVILSCVMRRYNFQKVGAGEVEVDEKGKPILEEGKNVYKTKGELFSSMVVTSKPHDKCMMRLKMSKLDI